MSSTSPLLQRFRSERIGAAAAMALGLSWIALGAVTSEVALLLATLPGSVLLAAGVSEQLWPGDRRPRHYAAAASLGAIPLGLLALPWLGLSAALLLVAGSAGVYLLLGLGAAARSEPCPDVPAPRASLALGAWVALDETLLATLHLRLDFPEDPAIQEQIRRDLEAALELDRRRGFDVDPGPYHRRPEPLTEVELRPARTLATAYEHLRAPSGFLLDPEEAPRRGFAHPSTPTSPAGANGEIHAWVRRHPDRTRPWVIGINGFRMGEPLRDWLVFPPRLYHEQLGLNVALLAQPLHGPRSIGRFSGDGFLDGDPLVTRYAVAQCIWDLRRLVGWIRAQGASCVGVAGVSLGGYAAALLASLEEVDFVIAGTPAIDLEEIYRRHGPPHLLRRLEWMGGTPERISRVLRPVSPLAYPVRTPHPARFIYAGVADQVVPPSQMHALYLHWQRPRMRWYQGGHLAWGRDLRPELRETLRAAGAL